MVNTVNQFQLAREKGTISPSSAAENVYYCRVDASEAGTLVAGSAVKIKDVVGKQIIVEAVAAISDDIFGFVVYNVKKSDYVANDVLNVATDNTVIMMEAGAAIAGGVYLQYTITGAKVITAATVGARIIGKALNKAAADGDLIPVLTKTPTLHVQA
jgi:hypothetical protein